MIEQIETMISGDLHEQERLSWLDMPLDVRTCSVSDPVWRVWGAKGPWLKLENKEAIHANAAA
ncbi:hypothetical protein [Rhizobium bangladeshense]|uniref:Uncharacterized protein n=1 Tax=Rhizobium bangladeshense TaxID=1138189 RepID=A0ABS7LHI9_9HYPH|nr:hypothetical protein [Rhizobium bangladeshense]TLX12375.1 hypothetical protein FFR93_17670 [Rhizobium sp. MHM7A]MBX4872812.1 hypothetical protein [Rhizobium bangladeshense]MBX4889659.1 hypothetical protein [Rhizobium bangladeshense]MBX4895327.1 hypothetical protein [Rhizobium bangladeshense]MBX4913451.1 hypothetical protein [Rhizobium bangladeshense]